MGIISTPTEGYGELTVELTRIEGTLGHVRMSGVLGEWEDTLDIHLGPDMVEWALASASGESAQQVWIKRPGSVDTMDPLREIGQQLFSALFRGERAQLFSQALAISRENFKGLRLRLLMKDKTEAWRSLPWEFMHDGDHFINLSPWSPVVRMVLPGVPHSPRPPVHPPLRVLVVAAGVTGEMEIERELDVVREYAGRSEMFVDTLVPQATPDRFLEYFLTIEPHVLHFVGGATQTPEGRPALVLMDKDGEVMPSRRQSVDDVTLVSMLKRNPEIRLLLLSGGHTSRLAAAVAPAVPAVIGMLGFMTGEACIEFTQGFYESLIGGGSLEDAMTVGRQMVDWRWRSSGGRQWGMPVLYLQAPDGVLLSRPAEARPLEDVLSDAEEKVRGRALTDPEERREWQKLEMRLEMQRRNLKELEGQLQASTELPVPFIEDQIRHTKAQIASLEAQLEDLVLPR